VSFAIGDVYSRHSFGKILDVTPSYVRVRNVEGKEWDIGMEIASNELRVARPSEELGTEKSRTELLEFLMANANTAITVTFRKKVDPKVVAKLLENGKGTMADRTWSSKVRQALEGEARTMSGYHRGQMDGHGRLMFYEVTDAGEDLRSIDPRTVERVVVGDVIYSVKS
jgi:ferredoxin-fold anticodon binding domain-containing protein